MLFLLFLRCSSDATWIHVFGEGGVHLPLPVTVVRFGDEEENWYLDALVKHPIAFTLISSRYTVPQVYLSLL